MALWNTFIWSDGTLWADANGPTNSYTSFIDCRAHSVSLRLTHTYNGVPGSLASTVILTTSIEAGIRSQQPHLFEAFIDRNHQTQRISVKVFLSATVSTTAPPTIDSIRVLANTRSRRQPS